MTNTKAGVFTMLVILHVQTAVLEGTRIRDLVVVVASQRKEHIFTVAQSIMTRQSFNTGWDHKPDYVKCKHVTSYAQGASALCW
jgi:hypothetical protein